MKRELIVGLSKLGVVASAALALWTSGTAQSLKRSRIILGLLGLFLSCAAMNAQSYEVFLGDRDLQRGVLRFDPSTNTTNVFGGCSVSSGDRYYYGIDFDPATGYLWACDTLQSRIVALDANGNCVRTISTPDLPTGLAIHPNGQHAFLTTNSNTVYWYDLSTGQQITSAEFQDVSGLYGLDFSTQGEFLYVCDFYGGQLLQLQVDLSNFTIAKTNRTRFSPRRYNDQEYNVNPYDVAVRTQYGGRAPIDHIYVTLTQGFYGYYSEVAYGQYPYDYGNFLPEPRTFAVHPNSGSSFVSFFGIELAPDGLLWVSQYNPGGLFTVDTNTAQVTQRADYGANKLGVGVAIRSARCTAHNGDVDNNNCVDDADLLAVLFAFGNTGQNLGRVDVNCDEVVDDADLLIVLFNFGQGCGSAQYKLYIPDRDAQRGVVVYDPATNSTSVFGGCQTSGRYYYCYGIDKHPNGEIWVCDHLGNSIHVLGANGNCVRTIAVPASRPRGIAVDPRGKVAVVAAGDALHPYNIVANSWDNPFASGGLFWGVAWDDEGRHLYATNGSNLFMYRWDGTSFTQVASGEPSQSGWSADVLVLHDRVLAAFGDRIEEFDLDCNWRRTVATASGAVHGLAQGSDGVIWVTVYDNGSLYRLDLNSGTLTFVANIGNLKVGSGMIAK